MSGLDAIEVCVEGPEEHDGTALNAIPLLHEIRHALHKLADSGETTTIDLSSIPFGPGDKEQLFDVLGHGEVEAKVDAMGDTRIEETAFAGVWLVHYFAVSGEQLATHIEVTRCPSLLVTPEQDLADAALDLQVRLAE
jgi:hydrogenase-1 operon protein HyaF